MPPRRLTLAQLNQRLVDEIGAETYARKLIKGTGVHVEEGNPRTLRALRLDRESSSAKLDLPSTL